MVFRSWLKWRKTKTKSRRASPRRREFYRPQVEQLEDRQLLATLTVNTVLDTNARDTVLTLREAILVANNTLPIPVLTPQEQAQISGPPTSPAPDTIAFDIPGTPGVVRTINVGSGGLGALPEITDPVIINGFSQPGSRPNSLSIGSDAILLIELNGAGAGAGANGLHISAGNSEVRGLVINRFVAIVGPDGSRDGGNGILITGNGSNGNGSNGNGGNLIQGNFIGIAATAPHVVQPNGNNGVLVRDSSDNLIGGTTPEARNVISGNVLHGIDIRGSSASFNLVQGNYLGTNPDGDQARGNGEHGMRITNAPNNTVGGTAAGARNVISANRDGVFIVGLVTSPGTAGTIGTAAIGNLVQGNFIGVTASGSGNLRNQESGIELFDAANNIIGGLVPGAGNTIAFNGDDGVFVSGTNTGSLSTGNAILANSIFSNGQLGINLRGAELPTRVTLNDIGDPDIGPNNLQNFPVLTAITPAGVIVGTLNSLANTRFRIEFFASDAALADPSGHGEGQTFLGSIEVFTDSAGNAPLAFTPTAAIAGRFVTATATRLVRDSEGTTFFDTSEFSRAIFEGCTPNQAFVFGLYRDVLIRLPDVNGFNGWVSALDRGLLTRAQVAAGFWTSPEHRGIEVRLFYEHLLDRTPSAAERAPWVNALLGGLSTADVVIQIIVSPEFQARHASNEAFVSTLYQRLFKRSGSADEVLSWVRVLQRRVNDRAGVAASFLGSREAFLQALNFYYSNYLGRGADGAGLNGWLIELENARQTPTSLNVNFLASDEYFRHQQTLPCFVPVGPS